MNGLWSIRHKQFSIAALSVALITMPFSIRLCHLSLILYLICWSLESKWNEKFNIVRGSLMLQLIFVFGIVQLVGMSYTENTHDGWFSIEKKIFLFLIPLALATSTIKFQQKEIRWMFYSFLLACLAGTVVCVISALSTLQLGPDATPEQISYFDTSDFKIINPDVSRGWLFFSYVSLAKGISIHPTFFSLYLAFCCIFILHELLTQPALPKRVTMALSFVLLYFTLFIICLSSRIVIVSLIAIYLVIIINLFFKRPLRLQAAALLVLVSTAIAVSYVNPVSRYRGWQEPTAASLSVHEHSYYKKSIEIRASLWWLSWKTFLTNNVIWGTGTGDVEAAIQKVSKAHAISNVINSFDPHNQYLYILVAHGVIGFAIFTMIVVLSFIPAWSRNDYLLLAFGFLFAALFLTETALELQKGIAFFAVVFSLLAFQAQSFQLNHFTLKFSSART